MLCWDYIGLAWYYGEHRLPQIYTVISWHNLHGLSIFMFHPRRSSNHRKTDVPNLNLHNRRTMCLLPLGPHHLCYQKQIRDLSIQIECCIRTASPRENQIYKNIVV
jgi:hypothetical protein